MQEILTQLQTVIQNNSILATLTSGSLIVWAVSNLRNIWNTIVDGILLCISFRIENFYEDNRNNDGIISPQQNTFNEIISNSKALFERTKNIDLSQSNPIKYSYDRDFDESNGESLMQISQPSLTFGFSIRILNGKIITCNRTMNTGGQKTMISTSIRVFFANKEKYMVGLEKCIVENMENKINEKNKSATINVYNGYTDVGTKTKRCIDSIFTNNNEHKSLLESIRKFSVSKELYHEMNYPYKYCGLLYGKPGTGKTSTILSIASELNYDIRYISMSDINFRELLSALNGRYGYGKKVIYVIEDIDAIDSKMNHNREDSDGSVVNVMNGKREEVSLSDFLNITDGLLTSDGLILLFTTNHIEKLDEAFLRDGRMNYKVEFDYLNHETANRMIEHHLGYGVENLKDDIKPTELQEEILRIKTGVSTKENLLKKFCKEN